MKKILFILLIFTSTLFAQNSEVWYYYYYGQSGKTIPPDYRTGLVYEWWADSNVTKGAGDSVTSWKNTVDTLAARQSTVGKKPTLLTNQINGRSALKFNGNYLTFTSKTLTTNFTVIIVLKMDTSSYHDVQYVMSSSGGVGVFAQSSNSNQSYGEYNAGSRHKAYNAAITDNWHILVFQPAKLFDNNVEPTYAGTTTLAAMIVNMIGSRPDVLTQNFIGRITHLRIYSTTLADADRITASDFLNYYFAIY